MIKKLNKSEFMVNGKHYEFMNTYKSSRSGFSHTSTLYLDGMYIGEYKVCYLNRTWEEYSYQTSMRCCIGKILDDLYQDAKKDYKKYYNIKRLCGKNKECFESQFNENTFIKELKEIKEIL